MERRSLPLFNKFFLSCSPRSAEGPPTSSGPRLLPFMTSSLSTTVSGRGQIFVISRCCCCNAAAALTFRRPLYFMLAIKAVGGGGREKKKRRKKKVKVILHLRSHLNVSERGAGLLLLAGPLGRLLFLSEEAPLSAHFQRVLEHHTAL